MVERCEAAASNDGTSFALLAVSARAGSAHCSCGSACMHPKGVARLLWREGVGGRHGGAAAEISDRGLGVRMRSPGWGMWGCGLDKLGTALVQDEEDLAR